MNHARFGGSTMARTLACAGWAKLADTMPRQKAGVFAHEGSLLHECMEETYGPNETLFEDMLEQGRHHENVYLTQEHIDEKLVPAEAAVEEVFTRYGVVGDFHIEPFVELIPDLAAGSIDMLMFSDNGNTAVILDYKFGFNQVDPEANAQLMFYALCASIDLQFSDKFKTVEKIALVIIQPTGEGDTLNIWETTKTELDVFHNNVVVAISAAEGKAPLLSAGDHCRYCPAAAVCPEKTGEAHNALMLDPSHLPTLQEALPLALALEDWVREVKNFAHEQAELGVHIEGFKLVAKRSTRSWNDVEAVTDKIRKSRGLLMDDAFDMKLKSPAQLEKVCKTKKVDFKTYADYISSISSGSTLVRDSDKRNELIALDSFDELAKLIN